MYESKNNFISKLIVIGYNRSSAEDIYYRYYELDSLEKLEQMITAAYKERKENVDVQ